MPLRKHTQLHSRHYDNRLVRRLWAVFAFPFALVAIGWKTYMINGAWDVVIIGLMWWYWVETKGMSLEEIDRVIDGEKHSDVPDLALIVQGRAAIEEYTEKRNDSEIKISA